MPRYPECDAYVRVQPGTAIPLGTLANGDLRALRRETHHYFDKPSPEGRMTKQEAYRWLANFLQAPQSQAHIGYLGGVHLQAGALRLQGDAGERRRQSVMKLTAEQQRKAEENMGLVGKVIADKVHGTYFGSYTREDLFQIGCIGLCKAAATDKGGCFSTYAYRLIWNEICTALISATRKASGSSPRSCPFWKFKARRRSSLPPWNWRTCWREENAPLRVWRRKESKLCGCG